MKRPLFFFTCIASTVLAFPSLSPAATVAYWRFEGSGNVSAGANGEPAFDNTVLDSSGNNNNFRTYATYTAPLYTTNVPTFVVPNTGSANTSALSFDGGDDLYSERAGGHSFNAFDFNQFTIETYVNLNTISGWQTFIGRDDSGNPGENAGPESLLYLQKRGDNNFFRFLAADSTGAKVEVNSLAAMTVNTWYHLAVVADNSNVSLYVDGVLQGTAAFNGGLFDPAANTIWTIGRGQFNGNGGDLVRGVMDEVRFSDTPLAPSQFLNAVPEPSSAVLSLAGLALLRRRRR